MPEPVRERILAALTAAVGGQYAIETPDDDRDLPVTAVQDDAEIAEAAYGSSMITLPVVVARAESAISQNKDAMRRQCNAIHAALIVEVSAAPDLQALVDGIDYTGGFIQAVGEVCIAQANFNVRYHTVAGDPYTTDEPED